MHTEIVLTHNQPLTHIHTHTKTHSYTRAHTHTHNHTQISYSIGIAEPLSIYIDTFGTSSKTNKELLQIVYKNFDLRPGMIIK